MSAAEPRLPEVAHAVEALDTQFSRDVPRIVDLHQRTQSELAEHTGFAPLASGFGLPLRPFVLARRQLEAICHDFQRALSVLRESLRGLAVDDFLAAVPIDRAFFEHFDVPRFLESPRFDWLARPDMFVFESRSLLSEPNYGNGWLITLVETEIIGGHLRTLDALPSNHERPFDAITESLRPPRGSCLAVVFHPEELDACLQPHENFIGHLQHAANLWAKRGVETRWVYGDGAPIPRFTQSSLPVGHWVCGGTGQTYLEPGRATEWQLDLAGAPLFQDIAGTFLQKGVLPHWRRCWPEGQPAAMLQIPETHLPGLGGGPELSDYLKDRGAWVLQRAFTFQRNLIGATTGGGTWGRAVQSAWGTGEWIAQKYVELPRTELPILVDGRVERVEVSVEVSPFILRGRYVGAFARYGLAEEGIVLSPAPTLLGLNTVLAV